MVYVATLVVVAREDDALASPPSTWLDGARRLAVYTLEDAPRGGVREMVLLPDAVGECALRAGFVEIEERSVAADAVYFMEWDVREEDGEDAALLDWVGGPDHSVYEVVGICLQLWLVDRSVEVHVVENDHAEGRGLLLRFRGGGKSEFENIVQSAECALEPGGSLKSQVACVTNVVVPGYVHQARGPRLRVLANGMEGLAAGFLAAIGYGDRGYCGMYEVVTDLLMLWEDALPEAGAAPFEFFVVDPLAT